MSRALTLNLPEMTCSHCVASVTQALQALDPAARVTADTEARQITVDSSAALEDVLSALCEVGFEATLAG